MAITDQGNPAIAWVLDATTGTSIAKAFDSSPTSGNLLIACLSGDKDTGTINTPTDDGTGTWTLIQTQNTTSVSGAMAYKVATGDEGTVTWTYTTARDSLLAIYEWSEVQVLDQSNENASGASVSTIQPGSITTTVADELICATSAWDTQNSAGTSSGWDSSFTEDIYVDTGNGTKPALSVAFRVVASTGSFNPTHTVSASDNAVATIASFYLPAGGNMNQLQTNNLGSDLFNGSIL